MNKLLKFSLVVLGLVIALVIFAGSTVPDTPTETKPLTPSDQLKQELDETHDMNTDEYTVIYNNVTRTVEVNATYRYVKDRDHFRDLSSIASYGIMETAVTHADQIDKVEIKTNTLFVDKQGNENIGIGYKSDVTMDRALQVNWTNLHDYGDWQQGLKDNMDMVWWHP